MARINVDPAAWAALRVQALQRNRYLVDLLGELIEAATDVAPPLPAPASSAAAVGGAATEVEFETDHSDLPRGASVPPSDWRVGPRRGRSDKSSAYPAICDG